MPRDSPPIYRVIFQAFYSSNLFKRVLTMPTPSLAMLDQTELLQLALQSGERNDAASALAYLKEAVARPDATATAHLLLGAEYAELGLYQRAMEQMEWALQVDPALGIARFQAGFLALSGGNAEKALALLQPLTEQEDALGLFAKGLIALMQDQFALAQECLRVGLAANQANLPLNQNIQRILDAIAALPEQAKQASGQDDNQLQHIMLSAYTGGTLH
jgi:tetratricopeptide (TPR) repeat protein